MIRDRTPTAGASSAEMWLLSAYSGADNEHYLAGWDEYQRRSRAEEAANGALRNSTVFVWNLDLAPAYLIPNTAHMGLFEARKCCSNHIREFLG
jgi:hypothetical protein